MRRHLSGPNGACLSAVPIAGMGFDSETRVGPPRTGQLTRDAPSRFWCLPTYLRRARTVGGLSTSLRRVLASVKVGGDHRRLGAAAVAGGFCGGSMDARGNAETPERPA
jgi:hypothetical protein